LKDKIKEIINKEELITFGKNLDMWKPSSGTLM
jgi:hypothetical protein